MDRYLFSMEDPQSSIKRKLKGKRIVAVEDRTRVKTRDMGDFPHNDHGMGKKRQM